MPNLNSPHKFDKSNLRKAVYEAPGQFEVGFGLAKNIKIDGSAKQNFKRAVFYGEGGSAFPVSLVNTLVRDAAEKTDKVPTLIYQNHTYSLTSEANPPAGRSALNVFCSYSGNTEETLTTLTKTLEKNLPAIAMASGGKLEEIAKDKGIPFIKLPVPTPDFQPRMGTGYFVGVILQLLTNHGLCSDMKDEVLGEVEGFNKSMREFEERGHDLASKIVGKTPVVWSSQKFKELARVWTIKFNEHAKNPAFWNFFPELNHNLMVGFTNLGERYFAIMLRDSQDDPENLRRYEITGDILKGYNMESVILDLRGANTFAKMFNSIYVADFVAYYLAEKNNIDPTPVEMVEELKKRLKS